MGKVKKEKIAQPLSDGKNKTQSPNKKKKSTDRSTSDDWNKKFGYFSPQSIKLMGETVGILGVSDDIASSLAEDVSYRLRSVVQLCAKYLKRTRQKRLTCQVVNDVLEMCDFPPIIGHCAHTSPHNFVAIREASIVVVDDPEIDLISFALSEISVPVKPPPVLVGKWLAPDDQKNKDKLDDRSNEPLDGATNTPFSSANHVANNHIKADGQIKQENHKVLNDYADNELPTNLIKYYGITCNTILGQNDLKLVLRDLAQNGKIVPIIPYLLNFITMKLRRLDNERQLRRLLQTLEALTENRKIDFTAYFPVTRVANHLLRIIKSNEMGAIPKTSLHQMRIRTAEVLAKILRTWCAHAEEQCAGIVQHMEKLLRSPLSSAVHVGTLTLLTELGSQALQTGFWTSLDYFINYLQHNPSESRYLEFAVINAAKVLYRRPHFTEVSGLPTAPELDALLYDFFGDALEVYRLHLMEHPDFLHRYFRTEGLKPGDPVMKRPWRLPKCRNSIYNPDAKRLPIHTAFKLPRSRKNHIIFKFRGAIPVPEMSLRRRRIDTPHAQFIPGKASEGHVVLVGQMFRSSKHRRSSPFSPSLFTCI